MLPTPIESSYEYLVLDDCWSQRPRPADGRLKGDPERFPSGMKVGQASPVSIFVERGRPGWRCFRACQRMQARSGAGTCRCAAAAGPMRLAHVPHMPLPHMSYSF